MWLNFEKWHGCQNDFIVFFVDDNDADLVCGSLKRQAKRLCARVGDGIAADGILVMHVHRTSDPLPYKITIINSDGSVASNCGNGLRCATRATLERLRKMPMKTIDEPEFIELELPDRTVTCKVIIAKSKTNTPLVSIDMGRPREISEQGAFQQEFARVCSEHKIDAKNFEIYKIDLGNPHLVIFPKQMMTNDIAAKLMRTVGPVLQKSAHWDGINVHVAITGELTAQDQQSAGMHLGAKISDLYIAWTWERGAGETRACGTGACAIALAAMASDQASRESWVAVDMPGGRLYVANESEEESVFLAGPAVMVYRGQVEI